MRRHEAGPRRSQSVDSFLRSTRLLAVAALLALAAAIVSDALEADFWARHALLAGLTGSVITVMVSVAVINEVLDRRRRQRWSTLAQFVMLELVRNARLIWTGLLAEVGLLPPEAQRPEAVDANRDVVRDTPRLVVAVGEVIADADRQRGLQEKVALLAAHTDEVLSRWAAVMLNTDVYAEVIDRHVELASDIGWLSALMDSADPPEDHRRQLRARSNPAVQIDGGRPEGDELANRIVVIAQLAEELDRSTLALALRIVPLEWWRARLGVTPPERGVQAS